MDKENAEKLIKKTTADYNLIASNFSRTRDYNPKDIVELAKLAKPGEKVLDFGCGNGRLSELFDENIEYFGADISEGMINEAKKRYSDRNFQCIKSPSDINLRPCYFDKIYSLAVFHHVPSEKLRQEYIQKLYDLLKSGGMIILTVWLPGEKSIKNSIAAEGLDNGDLLIAFKEDAETSLAERYVHVFTQDELVELIKKIGFKINNVEEIVRGHNGNRNLTVIAQKY